MTIPSMKVSLRFLHIQGEDFFKLVGSIVNKMEIINLRKRNTFNIVQGSKC